MTTEARGVVPIYWSCALCGFEKRHLDGQTAAPSCNGIEKDNPHGWCLMGPHFDRATGLETPEAIGERLVAEVVDATWRHEQDAAHIVAEAIRAERKEADALRAEVLRLQVQLAGCGVAAMQNTPDSAALRAKQGDYGWSASYGDVCAAVDREIALRAEVAGLKATLGATVKAADEDRATHAEAIRVLTEQKNGAYSERNKCVAALARMALALGWRAGVGQHADVPGESWDADWRTLVAIDLPTGQVTWHFHDSEKPLIEGLPVYAGSWDGHDTPTKYARLGAIAPEGLHEAIRVARAEGKAAGLSAAADACQRRANEGDLIEARREADECAAAVRALPGFHHG